ncbi:MAG: hypothetical protein II984_02825 [Clostridia bacterium]|nr:hypothetical protein [Clostridia bacterium]
MVSFKKYFAYQFRKSLPALLIMGVIALLLTFSNVDVYVHPDEIAEITDERITVSFGILAFILGALCTVAPVLMLSPFKNRRNLDTLLFLPVSRVKVAITHYLVGLIHVISVYTACFICTFLHLLQYFKYLFPIYLIPYYFLSVLYGIVLYSLFIFIFQQGSTVADGAIFILSYIFAPWAIVASITNTFDLSNVGEYFIIYAPIDAVHNFFRDKIAPDSSIYQLEDCQIFILILYGILGIASIFGFIYAFSKKRAEKVGDISDSYFGYKVIIPVLGYSLLLIATDILTIILLAAMFVAYIVYRRSARLQKSDYICLGAAIIPIILSSINR